MIILNVKFLTRNNGSKRNKCHYITLCNHIVWTLIRINMHYGALICIKMVTSTQKMPNSSENELQVPAEMVFNVF